jgi:hypothetical protein
LIEGVGKTSIILTLVSENFPRMVTKVTHPALISPDLYMLPINASALLVDSSSDRNDENQTDREIEQAHVINLVYNVNDPECIKRLRSYWIPRIQKINDKVIDVFIYVLDPDHFGWKQVGSKAFSL